MKIENRSGRQYDICWGGRLLASVPASRRDDAGAVTHGSAEIADDVLDEMLSGDDWTKAVFESGDLVRVGTPAKPAAASEPAPSEDAASVKGKPRK